MLYYRVPSMRLLHKLGLDNTYNDKSKFYKQSYTYMYAYMYASYMYTYAMLRCCSERMCCIIRILVTRMYTEVRFPRVWTSCYMFVTHVDHLSCG